MAHSRFPSSRADPTPCPPVERSGVATVSCSLRLSRLRRSVTGLYPSLCENRALVILEDGQPGCDIGGMVFPDLRCEPEVGGQEGTGKFCHQLLAGVALVAPVLAAEIAVQAARVARPVTTFVCEGGIEALGVAESLNHGQLDVIGLAGIEGAIAAIPDVGPGGREERLGM